MGAYIAFFRAVNVGKRQVKMDALRALHESLGYTDVESLVQSGNVVFRAKSASAKRIEDAFEKKFGFRSAVSLRSVGELEAALARHPFPPDGERQPNWVAFAFFPGAVDAAAKQALEAYEGPELTAVGEREVYVYYGEGMGRSKLPLKGDCTVRNWNTATKLLAMGTALL